jgi:inhibitor of KinA
MKLGEIITKVEARIEILPFGEAAILVEFGKGILPETHGRVNALTEYLDCCSLPGMIEYVSAYSSVTIFYDPIKIKKRQIESVEGEKKSSYQILSTLLKEIISKLGTGATHAPRVVEIPVCYGGDFGPDLEYVAEHNKLSIEKVIDIHASGKYLVYMIGFAPGFPFLGGMSEMIATPRRQSPRMSIPPGAVGIAGMQTGVYPITTPGGWQLIGRTPLALFRPTDNPPSLLQSGDIIRFVPISYQEYETIRGKSNEH